MMKSINTDCQGQGRAGIGQGVWFSIRSMAGGLVPCACLACLYIPLDEPPHARPIVIPGHQLQRFIPPHELGIMTLSQYLQLD